MVFAQRQSGKNFSLSIAVATSPAIMPLQHALAAGEPDSGLSIARLIFPVPNFAAGALSVRGNRPDPALDPD